MKRYYVFSYSWLGRFGNDRHGATGLFCSDHGIIGLYEHAVKQEENWLITHAQEISKEEYDMAEDRGIIG